MCAHPRVSDPLKTGRRGVTALEKQPSGIGLCSASVKMHVRGAAW